MSGTREVAEIVYATDPQRLSDMVKAGLLEPQSPGGVCAHPPVARLHAGAIGTAPIASRGADTRPVVGLASSQAAWWCSAVLAAVRKSTAFCACEAAVKTARLSCLRTFSHEAR